LRQNVPFSENCVAIWRFFAKNKSVYCLQFNVRLGPESPLDTGLDMEKLFVTWSVTLLGIHLRELLQITVVSAS
jgi:hypothetical protein